MKPSLFLLLSGIMLNAVCQTAGPSSGSLVIVGGAMKDTAIVNRFISLAGGADAPIVLIPTASGEQNIDYKRAAEVLASAGARNVTVLHTYDPKVADTEAFVAPLKKAGGVWFNGGRQWRFVDAYGGTLAETEIQKVLDRGGVIGGSSAGATIQGSYLVRGDTKTNTLVMGDHTRGFAYLKNSAIDQHLLVRNREHDLIEVISKYPELLGIGLDENTAVVVKGDIMEVIGQSYVAIYDHKLWPNEQNVKGRIPNGGRYFFLRKGDIYNVRTREVVKWGGDATRNIFLESMPVAR
jgi:cyanophycinase